MASDVSVGRGDLRAARESQADQLRDLQEDFKEQKASIQSAHESELRRIRNTNKRVENETRDSGDAAVVHIKTTTEDRVQSLQNEAREKIQTTADQSAREYADLKRRSAVNRESSRTEIEAERERAKQTLNAVRDNQTRRLEESQTKMKEALGRQQEASKKAQEEARAEVQSVQARTNKVLVETKAESQARLRKEQEQTESKLARTRSEANLQIESTRRQGGETLVQLRNQNQKQMTDERAESNRSLIDLREKSKTAYTELQSDADKRRVDLERTQAEQLKNSRERYLETNEKTQREYSRETQRVQQDGEHEIETRKTVFRNDIKKQDDEYRDQTQQRTELAQAGEKRDRELLRQKIDERQKLHEATLQEQKSDFDARLIRNDSMNKTSLQNQREKYLTALYQQQQDYDRKFDKIAARESDPFYAVQSFDARLEEAADHYILRAKIPPHERDHLEVRVKDEKVTLSASRQVEQKRNEEGTKVASSAFQTWRQEIPLKMPIYREGVTKVIEDDGTITVKIPKRI